MLDVVLTDMKGFPLVFKTVGSRVGVAKKIYYARWSKPHVVWTK